MAYGHDWRSQEERADSQYSQSKLSRGVVLTSSSILLLITILIFWPILQFKVSPASAGDSTPTPSPESIDSSTSPTPTLTNSPQPTPTSTPSPTELPAPTLVPPAEIEESQQTSVSTPLQSGLIVLALYEAGHSHLFAYQVNNTPFTRLTSGPWDDTSPALSPDGRWLAFASNRAGPWDLYLLELPTGEVTRLTNSQSYESSPTWSPDGNLIAYESYAQDSEIFIQSVFNDQTLINLSEHPAADYQPAWSPMGRQLAFISTRTGDAEVWLANFDKFDEERFINLSMTPDMAESYPSWSPDGTELAWASTQTSTHSVVAWNFSSGSRYIGSGDRPAWSPDGTTILTSLDDPNQSMLTAYRSTDGQLTLPPFVLPGKLSGLNWNDQSLPTPLPENLLLISSEVQALPWLTNTDAVQGNLVNLTGVQAPYPELHDAADDAFQALRDGASSAAGWDFLGTLENAFVPLSVPLSPGLGEDWLYTGRAIAFDTLPMNAGWVVVVPEYFGHEIYWRIYIKARFQNGSLGKPMDQVPWNFNARFEGDPLLYEQGGQTSGTVPQGYWIDFTDLALAYGWQRLPALPTWQSAIYTARFNEFVLTTTKSWDEAMLDLYPAELLTTPTPIYPPTLTPTRTPSWPIAPTPAP
jgi:TolB protein